MKIAGDNDGTCAGDMWGLINRIRMMSGLERAVIDAGAVIMGNLLRAVMGLSFLTNAASGADCIYCSIEFHCVFSLILCMLAFDC